MRTRRRRRRRRRRRARRRRARRRRARRATRTTRARSRRARWSRCYCTGSSICRSSNNGASSVRIGTRLAHRGQPTHRPRLLLLSPRIPSLPLQRSSPSAASSPTCSRAPIPGRSCGRHRTTSRAKSPRGRRSAPGPSRQTASTIARWCAATRMVCRRPSTCAERRRRRRGARRRRRPQGKWQRRRSQSENGARRAGGGRVVVVAVSSRRCLRQRSARRATRSLRRRCARPRNSAAGRRTRAAARRRRRRRPVRSGFLEAHSRAAVAARPRGRPFLADQASPNPAVAKSPAKSPAKNELSGELHACGQDALRELKYGERPVGAYVEQARDVGLGRGAPSFGPKPRGPARLRPEAGSDGGDAAQRADGKGAPRCGRAAHARCRLGSLGRRAARAPPSAPARSVPARRTVAAHSATR